MDYEQARGYYDRMSAGELPQILTERGIDIHASDKRNAALREDYGDTPYSAPDVDPATGMCEGGDAWPMCCEGHKLEDHVTGVVAHHESVFGRTPPGRRGHFDTGHQNPDHTQEIPDQ
jgi:hypothetical protein